MSAEFRKCLKLERDRARSRRESAQGKFEAAMLSLDQHVESFDDPGKIAVFSDGCADAERVYSYDESVDDSYYTRRIKVARRRLQETGGDAQPHPPKRQEPAREYRRPGGSPSPRSGRREHALLETPEKNFTFLQGPVKAGARTMFRAPYRVVLMRGNAKNPRLRHEGGRAIRERFPSDASPRFQRTAARRGRLAPPANR